MNNAHEHGGWTISEVERLTGLPRRDIQRCCYSGKGGLGIIKPQDSTWGRRTYSVDEIALLYVCNLNGWKVQVFRKSAIGCTGLRRMRRSTLRKRCCRTSRG